MDDPFARVASQAPDQLSLDDLVLAALLCEGESAPCSDAMILEARRRMIMQPSDSLTLLTFGKVVYHGKPSGEVPDDLRIEAQTALHQALGFDPGLEDARAYLVHFAHEAGEWVQCISIARTIDRQSYRDIGLHHLLMRVDENEFDAMNALGSRGRDLADVIERVVELCRRMVENDGFLVWRPELLLDRARTLVDTCTQPRDLRARFGRQSMRSRRCKPGRDPDHRMRHA